MIDCANRVFEDVDAADKEEVISVAVFDCRTFGGIDRIVGDAQTERRCQAVAVLKQIQIFKLINICLLNIQLVIYR
jgi:hypothetical protein